MVWVKLRELKPLGFHFRRQAPIRHLIVDFASFRDCLVIEVDGGQHGMVPGRSPGCGARCILAWRRLSRAAVLEFRGE
jgi:hypothetical protein